MQDTEVAFYTTLIRPILVSVLIESLVDDEIRRLRRLTLSICYECFGTDHEDYRRRQFFSCQTGAQVRPRSQHVYTDVYV